jgi:hypothetical protein
MTGMTAEETATIGMIVVVTVTIGMTAAATATMTAVVTATTTAAATVTMTAVAMSAAHRGTCEMNARTTLATGKWIPAICLRRTAAAKTCSWKTRRWPLSWAA